VAAGVTVHEALAAHEALLQDGIATRVIDAYSVRPLDEEALTRAAEETGVLVVVEDHWLNGGLGDAVSAVVAGLARVRKLGVSEQPHSGKPEELLARAGISRDAIADAVREVAVVSPVPTA
jgi:transketolase